MFLPLRKFTASFTSFPYFSFEIKYTHGALHLLIWYFIHGLFLRENILSEQFLSKKAASICFNMLSTEYELEKGPKKLFFLFIFPLYFLICGHSLDVEIRMYG